MNKREINKFIPYLIVRHRGKTLRAIQHHFVDGLNINDAAKEAGISRQAISVPIKRTRENLLIAGYRQHKVWVSPEEQLIKLTED